MQWLTVLALCLAAAMGAGCHRTPPEAQVRAAIDQAADAVRSRDAGALSDLLSDDLTTPGHDMDRSRLLGLLRLARLRNERIKVLLGPVAVEPAGDRMRADFTVTLGGGGGLIPQRLGVYRVRSAWRREHGDWRCYYATWKRQL